MTARRFFGDKAEIESANRVVWAALFGFLGAMVVVCTLAVAVGYHHLFETQEPLRKHGKTAAGSTIRVEALGGRSSDFKIFFRFTTHETPRNSMVVFGSEIVEGKQFYALQHYKIYRVIYDNLDPSIARIDFGGWIGARASRRRPIVPLAGTRPSPSHCRRPQALCWCSSPSKNFLRGSLELRLEL